MAQRFDPNTGLPVTAPPIEPLGQQLPTGVTINMGDQPGHPVTTTGDAMSAQQLADLEVFVNAERERVRNEEKNKLYPEIQELRSTVGELQADRQARQDAETQAEADRIEQARLAEEAQMSQLQLFERRQEESEARIRQLQESNERERVLREKEAEWSALVGYKARRMAEEADNIMPQFVDFVRGNTEAEIEASIADVKTRTEAIVADVQQSTQQQRRLIPLPVSGTPPVDMQGGGDQERELSVEDLRNMTAAEYEAYRPQLLAATSQRVREQGVYAP